MGKTVYNVNGEAEHWNMATSMTLLQMARLGGWDRRHEGDGELPAEAAPGLADALERFARITEGHAPTLPPAYRQVAERDVRFLADRVIPFLRGERPRIWEPAEEEPEGGEEIPF